MRLCLHIVALITCIIGSACASAPDLPEPTKTDCPLQLKVTNRHQLYFEPHEGIDSVAIDGLVTVQPFYEIHPADRIDVSRGCVVRRVRSAEILAGRSIYLGEVTGAWEFASINSNASPFTVEPGHYFALGAYGRKTVSKPVVCVCISEVFEVKEAFQVFVVNEVEE